MGWPKPTIYREHEVIHILANLLDNALQQRPEPVQLQHDEWLMKRIDRALEAILYSEREGLETALDFIAFAEDVLNHYRPKEAP